MNPVARSTTDLVKGDLVIPDEILVLIIEVWCPWKNLLFQDLSKAGIVEFDVRFEGRHCNVEVGYSAFEQEPHIPGVVSVGSPYRLWKLGRGRGDAMSKGIPGVHQGTSRHPR